MQALQHHYLHAMGIQVWQSRENLPGAKPACPVTELSEVALPFTDDVVSVGTDNDSLELATAVNLSTSTLDGSETISIPLIVPAAEKLQLSKTGQSLTVADPDEVIGKKDTVVLSHNPEFRIASIIFPGVCVVLTQVPIQAVGSIPAPQLTLLKELLQAVSAPLVNDPLVTFFNWPMLRSSGFDQSAAAARDASQAFLRGQISKHTLSFVLLMGDAPSQYLLSEDGSFADKAGRLQHPGQQPRLLTHSLEQIFADAALKAEVWCDLQPLIVWQQQQ